MRASFCRLRYLHGRLVWALLPCLFGETLAASAVDFARDVLPILEERCHACHGASLVTANLRLDRKNLAMKGGDSGPVIVAGKGEESLLIQRITGSKLGIRMPPTGALPELEIAVLRDWIDQGAPWPDEAGMPEEPGQRRVKATAAKLFAAIRANDLTSVGQMLGAGANLAVRDALGDTPLMYAALYGSEECVRMLLDHGADPNKSNDSGATALMRAAGSGDKAGLLLRAGAKVDARSDLSRTALLIAARKDGSTPVLEELLAQGADPHAPDSRGVTPVMEAARAGDARALQLLIEQDADVNAVRNNGRTALMAAVRSRRLAAVRVLLDHGADVNVQAAEGPGSNSEDTALTMAAARGTPGIVEALLKKGANTTARNQLGYTALMQAAYSDYVDTEAVRTLLAHGADVNVQGKDGETPLSLAKKRGETAVVRLLREAGATK